MKKIMNSFALLVGLICSGQYQFVLWWVIRWMCTLKMVVRIFSGFLFNYSENCMTNFSDDCLSKCIEVLFGKISCSICPLHMDLSINSEETRLVFSEKSFKKSESRLVELCFGKD